MTRTGARGAGGWARDEVGRLTRMGGEECKLGLATTTGGDKDRRWTETKRAGARPGGG